MPTNLTTNEAITAKYDFTRASNGSRTQFLSRLRTNTITRSRARGRFEKEPVDNRFTIHHSFSFFASFPHLKCVLVFSS